ncbi:GPW/gp25 family protein [Kitasatospora sp. NPDC091257]|uniref:GPW/gp25 family protein n=1 Tax=unclassified Kitasatospora TaxID=2633591 RepID=UPI00380B25C8
MDELIGKGWTFPATVADDGTIALVGGAEDIDRSIQLIMRTMLGERPMRPEFGCGVSALVFAPIDATTGGQIIETVHTALERWEPRIAVDEVDVTADTVVSGLLYIDISYRILATNSPRNLVFPFYTLPGEPGTGTAGA